MEKQRYFLKITIFETLDTDFSYLLQILAGSIRLIISFYTNNFVIILCLTRLSRLISWIK